MKHGSLDLFAGIGGFSLGLERTGGFETLAFCEQDQGCHKVLRKHWPGVKIYEDIKDLTYERLEADGIRPSVITAGFPCTDISTCGHGKGIVEGKQSSLWSEAFRLCSSLRPAWIIIENVSAIRSKGATLVLQNLSSLGYLSEFHCIPASALGAPHRRDRWFCIARPDPSCIGQPGFGETHDDDGKLALRDEPDGLCEDVADTSSERRGKGGDRLGGNGEGDSPPGQRPAAGLGPDNGGGDSLADADGNGREPGGEGARPGGLAGSPEALRGQGGPQAISSGDSSRILPDANGDGTSRDKSEDREGRRTLQDGQGPGSGKEPRILYPYLRRLLEQVEPWPEEASIEPPLCRVVDGVSGRLDGSGRAARLKQLGNAVVPAIPALIGQAILDLEGE